MLQNDKCSVCAKDDKKYCHTKRHSSVWVYVFVPRLYQEASEKDSLTGSKEQKEVLPAEIIQINVLRFGCVSRTLVHLRHI